MSPQNTPGPCGHASSGGNFASSAAKPQSAGCAVEALAVSLAVAVALPVAVAGGTSAAELASGAEAKPTTTLTAPLFPAPAALRPAPAEPAASSLFGALFGASQPYCATSRSSAGARGRRGGSKELQASRRWKGRAVRGRAARAGRCSRWDRPAWDRAALGSPCELDVLLSLGAHPLPIDRRIQQNVHFERPSLRADGAMRTKSGGCRSFGAAPLKVRGFGPS